MEGVDALELINLVNECHEEFEYRDLPVYVNGKPLQEMGVNLATVTDRDTDEPFVALVIE